MERAIMAGTSYNGISYNGHSYNKKQEWAIMESPINWEKLKMGQV